MNQMENYFKNYFSTIKNNLDAIDVYKLEKIINGEELDEFIDTLIEQDQISKLAQMGDGN